MEKQQLCRECAAVVVYAVLLVGVTVYAAISNHLWSLGLLLASIIGLLYIVGTPTWGGQQHRYLFHDQDTVFGVVVMAFFCWVLIPIDLIVGTMRWSRAGWKTSATD